MSWWAGSEVGASSLAGGSGGTSDDETTAGPVADARGTSAAGFEATQAESRTAARSGVTAWRTGGDTVLSHLQGVTDRSPGARRAGRRGRVMRGGDE
ncbi:hypothetical protein LILAB_22980 [Corallococcus macrosporus]|uniref:Uncharacterized protein n=1 Tax=Myxococcus fulvus (strain ATCC BAA-855 / HW-1) TaxID=483219 RepID=F8CLG7_MYXFH|nr:hypothetical protein LILAB_22980 [Corallococcus macrosporus]